ncbi:MAG: serine/threonine-protein kinase [Leptolyngbyaceae cyanobacterium MO_188.B28]|nr:serine/threonine-protein kinase [Leptolyngbyaceae cyanobacterium MO_188.B28]
MFTSIRPKRSNYRLLGLVGQGQFGRVFCAIHRKTGDVVALKDLNRDRLPTHKFLRELRFLLSLEHPNIVTCKALEHSETGRQLVLDYCEGGPLRRLIEQEVQLSLTDTLNIVSDVLAGLDHAHSKGIIHCDIKPENILLMLQSDRWVAKLSDFGIARLSQELNSAQLGDTGSPAYMAPERFENQYSVHSDIYSIGVILFELLFGRRPFSGTPLELMQAHLNQPVSVPNTAPKSLCDIIQTALQKHPDQRFQSALDMLAAVKQVPASAISSSTLLASPSPEIAPPPSAFQAQAVDRLSGPLQCLAIASKTQVFQSSGDQLILCNYPNGLLSADKAAVTASCALPDPIQTLEIIPQGCCVITARSIQLAPFAHPPTEVIHPAAIAEFSVDSITAIAPSGQWFAAISHNPTDQEARLRIGRFPTLSLSLNAGNPLNSDLRQIVLPGRTASILQLLTVDNRHLVIISTHSISGKQTTFEIFTRRGDYLGTLKIGVLLQTVILTPTPYRLLAIEQDNPSTILIIDVKPFRLFRLKLDIAPILMTATDWGYLFMDSQGRLLLLDRDTHTIGRIDGPSRPTAMVSYSQHGLLIATWEDIQGQLFRVDLRELDLDILF